MQRTIAHRRCHSPVSPHRFPASGLSGSPVHPLAIARFSPIGARRPIRARGLWPGAQLAMNEKHLRVTARKSPRCPTCICPPLFSGKPCQEGFKTLNRETKLSRFGATAFFVLFFCMHFLFSLFIAFRCLQHMALLVTNPTRRPRTGPDKSELRGCYLDLTVRLWAHSAFNT